MKGDDTRKQPYHKQYIKFPLFVIALKLFGSFTDIFNHGHGLKFIEVNTYNDLAVVQFFCYPKNSILYEQTHNKYQQEILPWKILANTFSFCNRNIPIATASMKWKKLKRGFCI
ncbi:CLUMA_CG010096, isoform A [Clunio marinus]|uniref:CLUMA_CG010096, isoform A n=1 Tax=Clunio marinus TaxID=568069 RepID=A0A1J1I9J0_9DIPT|nr:CLUMA_CG010096, isoform A [Clunio marinus]